MEANAAHDAFKEHGKVECLLCVSSASSYDKQTLADGFRGCREWTHRFIVHTSISADIIFHILFLSEDKTPG